MNWAINHIASLSKGLSVTVNHNCKNLTLYFKGVSSITITPLSEVNLIIGDDVLCKVKGNIVFRKIKYIRDNVFTVSDVGNNIDGRVTKTFIYGKCSTAIKG